MQKYVENIPKELQDLRQWVCWKKGANQENGKPTKLPIDAMTGRFAKVSDPSTFTTMQEAIIAEKQFGLDGIGFVFTGKGYFGIDLDDCPEELKNEFINHMQSYSETSQSGNGIHIICKGQLPKGRNRVKGIEMYDDKRYFIMTGDKIGNYDLVDGTEKVKHLYNKYLKKETTKPITSVVVQDSITLDDTTLITKAQRSKSGQQFSLLMQGIWAGQYPSQSEADLAFCNLLAFWSGKDADQMDRIFRISALMRDKWDRKQSGSTYGKLTIDKAIENCQAVYGRQYEDETSIYINAHSGEVVTVGSKNYTLDDSGNAERLKDRIGQRIRFNFDTNKWLIWNGKFWEVDRTNQIKFFAEVIIAEMRKEAEVISDEKTRKALMRNVTRASQTGGKKALLEESKHYVQILSEQLDNDDFLLNTLDGMVDLKTGVVYEHNKEKYMSYIINHQIDRINKPVKWLAFLDEIFQGDKELINFIHKAVGYTLTGSIREQSMFLTFGDGSNGKSVFLDVIKRLLCDYGANAQVETLLERKSNGSGGASEDLARLKGVRFVTTGENSQGSKLNEGLIKQMTGGEKITARHLYAEYFEFYPKFKIWLATNHKPIIRGNDTGIWRRIISIPFNYKVPREKRNKSLIFELQEEMGAILKWAIDGCLKWQKEGLKLPDAITKSNQDYQEEMDIITIFLKDHTKTDPQSKVLATKIYQEYVAWAKSSNEWVASSTIFGRELGKRFKKKRTSKGVWYLGLKLKSENPEYVYEK
jgi:putative DNA primase/helicase